MQNLSERIQLVLLLLLLSKLFSRQKMVPKFSATFFHRRKSVGTVKPFSICIKTNSNGDDGITRHGDNCAGHI
jgi:hypothetical protein